MPAFPGSARERRTIIWGIALSAIALVGAFVIAPVARRWSAREDAIAAARDRVARLRGLSLASNDLVAASLRLASDPAAPRALRGRTVALVGSELQSLLQEHARASRVSVNRLDVAVDSAGSGEVGVSAALSATTDVYGLADFLTRLQGSATVLVTDDLSVSMNPVLRGNLLQVSVSVRAPFVLEPN